LAVVRADLSICQGYANCMVSAEDYFDMDDSGVLAVLQATVPDADRARVEQAARSCPVAALTLADD
jgi:ferredoxin